MTQILDLGSSAPTLAGLAVLRGGEAHLALAAVAAGGVQTLAVFAQVHVVSALVHVWKKDAHGERPMSARQCLFTMWALVAGCVSSSPEQEKPSPLKPSLQVHL